MIQNRRIFCLGAGAGVLALSGCVEGNRGLGSEAGVDGNVNDAIAMMYARLPYTRELASQARGILVMPGVYKGGFVVGAAYGEGALRVPGDGYSGSAAYYAFAGASVGWQAGVQKTAHALFFMADSALQKFNSSQNWEVGADAEVTLLDTGVKADLNTTVAQKPVLAVVFNQAGLMAGASLEGAKYTRISI